VVDDDVVDADVVSEDRGRPRELVGVGWGNRSSG
jgi:hypothetical protein